MCLHVHQDKIGMIDLKSVLNEFIESVDRRKFKFVLVAIPSIISCVICYYRYSDQKRSFEIFKNSSFLFTYQILSEKYGALGTRPKRKPCLIYSKFSPLNNTENLRSVILLQKGCKSPMYKTIPLSGVITTPLSGVSLH